MSLVFDIANWLIIGAAIYIFLDIIPNGPLSWKILNKFSAQSDFAIKTIISLGFVLLLAEAFFIGLNYSQFVGDQIPMSSTYNFYLALSIFSIPLVSQLFRIELFKKSVTYCSALAFTILGLDLFKRFYNPFEIPRRFYASSDESFLDTVQFNPIFHYFISICLFFIVLDFVVLLKKHDIIKS